MILLKLYLLIWAIIYAVMVFKALKKSNLPCLGLFHRYEIEYDSETEKWKNGRRPMGVSVGGFTEYKCEKCGSRYTESWSAF